MNEINNIKAGYSLNVSKKKQLNQNTPKIEDWIKDKFDIIIFESLDFKLCKLSTTKDYDNYVISFHVDKL